MNDGFDNTPLTEQEAAAILQPHMPDKSAKHWLERDRLRDPIIPFHLVQEQPYYLEADLRTFITHMFSQTARFVRIGNHLRTDVRNESDRRQHTSRRINVEIMLSHGIERRQPSRNDRRFGRDRRTQPAN